MSHTHASGNIAADIVMAAKALPLSKVNPCLARPFREATGRLAKTVSSAAHPASQHATSQ
jgi:hypothetical protein